MTHNDAYAAWDPTTATDKPDGLADVGIVPLIEFLRARGIITRQSCSGHLGSDDGNVMFDPATLPESVRQLRGHPFSVVRETYEPEPWFELWWHPADLDEAVAAIRAACRGEQR